MRSSTYKKVHRDILLEWVYDDNNNITEPFSVLTNNRERTKSYMGSNLTNNGIDYQLFPLNKVEGKYAKVDATAYNFLSQTDYSSQGPLRHDQLNIRMPNNYDFEEYRGFYLRVYAYDFNTRKTYDISNFFFNKDDEDQYDDMLDTVAPPILYEDRLWDQNIILDLPSVNTIALQLDSGSPTPGSINDVLTGGEGLSMTTPIFIDFHWITSIKNIGGEIQYTVTTPFTIEIPQEPALESLGLFIEESLQGDFFEINPLYNGTFEDYITFMDSSRSLGNVYVSEYLVTIFEQNIKGKTTRFLIERNYEDKIEWRPIIKYSTTTAIIDVELRMTDRVDGTTIIRKALYGMKPEQTSKYALNLKKIKVRNINKPKIYVKRSAELAELDAITRKDPQKLTVKVKSPNLLDLNGIHAYSSNALNFKQERKIDNYHPMGILKIVLEPFDNIIRFILARKSGDALEFIDLTNCQDMRLSFKSEVANYQFDIYPEPNMNSAAGMCNFRIPSASYQDLKKLLTEGENLFYITTNNNQVRTVLYSGQFTTSDSQEVNETTDNLLSDNISNTGTSIITDPGLEPERGTAIVTRRRVRVTNQPEEPTRKLKVNNLKLSTFKYPLDPRIKKN